MTRFVIRSIGIKPLISIAAVHGLTDLDTAHWPQCYGVLMLLPLPSPIITSMFCIFSVLHFAEDLGIHGSMLFHTFVAVLTRARGVQTALKAMVYYLCLYHVPMHFVRCFVRKRFCAIIFTLTATCVAVHLSSLLNEEVLLTDNIQKIVVAHIITEFGIMSKSPI